jgi:hypothetical protein
MLESHMDVKTPKLFWSCHLVNLHTDYNVSEKHKVSIFIPEERDGTFLRNVGTYQQANMALQTRRPTSTNYRC